MAKSTPCKCFALILCFGAANLPAQEQSMIPPPIPSVVPPEPPDPDTLTPPQLEWAPLTPQDSVDESGSPPVVFVPPSQPEDPVVPPSPPLAEAPSDDWPDPAEMELAKPEVEIWRELSEYPQIPARTSNRLAQTYVTGTEPVWLRVQFDPQAAGKSVYVKPAWGITLEPPAAILTISSTGECLFLARIAEGFTRSHIVFYCDGVKTVLPVCGRHCRWWKRWKNKPEVNIETSGYSRPSAVVLFCHREGITSAGARVHSDRRESHRKFRRAQAASPDWWQLRRAQRQRHSGRA